MPRMPFSASNEVVKRLPLCLLLVCVLPAANTHPVQLKIDAIEKGRVRSGSHVVFDSRELNSWSRAEAAELVPGAVSNLRLDLHEGRATGSALIDFLKLKQASGGDPPGYIARRLLSGVRPVSVTARVESAGGKARVDVERVEISGVPLEGAALDFLIQTYLHATFPEARAGEWFALDKHVDRLAVHPDNVVVVVR